MLLGSEPADTNKPTGPQRVLYVLKECPVSFISDETRELLQFYTEYSHFSDRSLPESGGYLEQPAVMLDVIRTVKEEMYRVEQSRQREQERKAEHERAQMTRKGPTVRNVPAPRPVPRPRRFGR